MQGALRMLISPLLALLAQPVCDLPFWCCTRDEEIENEDDRYIPPPAGGRVDEKGLDIPVLLKTQVRCVGLCG